MTFEAWKKFEAKDVPATTPVSEVFLAKIGPGTKLLEVGCGFGRLAETFAERGCDVSGIDINENAIAHAQENPSLSSIDFRVEDAEHTSFPAGSFDAATLQGLIATMHPESRRNVLTELSRILKQNGLLHIAEFSRNEENHERYATDAEITGEYGTVVVRNDEEEEMFRTHHFSKEELENLLLEHGFEIETYELRDFPTLKGKLKPGHIFIARKI